MTFPFAIGLPQVILFIMALIGVLLFVYAAHSLIRGEKHYGRLTDEEKERYYQSGKLPRRRHLRWKHGTGGVILLLISISLLWLTVLIQAYLGFTGDIRVAVVRATNITGGVYDSKGHLLPGMSVDLTLYDQSGNKESENTYQVLGNEWIVQSDFIKITNWMNVVGLHSGYKL